MTKYYYANMDHIPINYLFMNKIKEANIILIGCGPHSTRVYLPAIKALNHLKLKLVIDLKNKKSIIGSALKEFDETELLLIDPFESNLPSDLSIRLSQYVRAKNITGVIIATEPLVHKVYSNWAIENKLNILMDKPITARVDAVSNLSNAKGILDDFTELLANYRGLQQEKETVFMINSQRRFHKGFEFVKQKINEVSKKTNCPVTFIQAYHCDGQWRLPNEIVTQEYHPYCSGYGKASHSGYHIFDTIYQFYKAGEIKNKIPDSMEIVSSFIQPNGFISQFNEGDYYKLFGEQYRLIQKYSDEELREIFNGFGELDLSAIITLKKDNESVANFNINLLHNGFAGRTWISPGTDLYKGNGRIKHESYNIQQGPFQNIQLHAYQATDRHDDNKDPEYYLGGKNHFEIYVFRNPLLTEDKDRLKVYRYEDISDSKNCNDESRIAMESVKFTVVKEFADYLVGINEKNSVKSQIEDHFIPVQIMSGIYSSNIIRKEQSNNIFQSFWGKGAKGSFE